MDEKKFTLCELAVETLVLKVGALKPENESARKILKYLRFKEEDWTEERVAMELDDIYEHCVLKEPDDEDNKILEELIKALRKELPNYEEYKKIYNWTD